MAISQSISFESVLWPKLPEPDSEGAVGESRSVVKASALNCPRMLRVCVY